MDFVANFIRFHQCKSFENWLRFDKVTESLMVCTVLRCRMWTIETDWYVYITSLKTQLILITFGVKYRE